MNDKLREILADLEKQGRSCTHYETNTSQDFTVIWGNVRVGDRLYPCDTAVYLRVIDQTQPLSYSEYCFFATFICKGLNGKTGESFNQIVDKLNYDLLGKLVRDYTDSSQDILYVTSERMHGLTTEVFQAHLYHHAKVKATYTPKLEKLIDC